MPVPRSRKAVAVLERAGTTLSEEGAEAASSRKASSFASASESSNQTVPSSEGLAAWLETSAVYSVSQLWGGGC